MAEEKPIIVIKKKGGHGAHHGGAWKVAYADFVTAMMCFFMVMWLINSADTPSRQAIAAYFKRPGLFETGSGTPLLSGGAGILPEGGAPAKKDSRKFTTGDKQAPMKKKSGALEEEAETGGGLSAKKSEKPAEEEQGPGQFRLPKTTSRIIPPGATPSLDQLEEMAGHIRRQIGASPELQQLLGVVDVKVDADGLNIEIIDTEKTSMFALGSAVIQPEAQAAFAKIGAILAKLPNSIDIVGHTDAKPFSRSYHGGYSNWELSADRANAARRLLEKSGIAPERFSSVLGRADKDLKNPKDPFAASNRRITLKMRFPANQVIELPNEPQDLGLLPTLNPSPSQQLISETKPPEAKVHTLTPAEILGKQKKEENKTIPLPDEEPPISNPAYMEKDKIFSHNPVLGPVQPFTNF